MDTHTLQWTGAAAMAAGGALILRVGQRRTASEETQTIIHGIVPLVAACAYFAMASGQGSAVLRDGREFYFLRYADWLVTTPLLLLSLALAALHEGPRRHGLIGGLLLADAMMIGAGFAFGASTAPAVKWTWYAISCGAFAAVLYVMWRPLLRANAAERDDVRAEYRRDVLVLTGLWLAYPLVIIPAPDGLGLISEALATGLLLVLDLLSKVAYGLLATKGDAGVTARDLSSGRSR